MGTGGLFLRRLRAKVADEPTGFVWVEQGRLAGSGYPASRTQVEWLFKAGIRGILTLTEKPLPSELTEALDLEVRHLPMKDHGAPSPESMDKAVEIVQGMLGEGRPVMVHCLAGEGRTGCVLSAYLIRTRNLGAKEALEELRKAKPEFVEWQQEKAVYGYASSIRGDKRPTP